MGSITKKQLEKRNQIIEAATNLMNEIGFENATVRGICKAADISIGSFYHYFNDKGDIIIELYKNIDNYLEEKKDEFDEADELKNILLFSEFYGEYVSASGIASAKQVFSASINTESHKIYRSKERTINRMIFEIISRAKDKGQIVSELTKEDIADMVLINIRGIVFDWCKHQGQYDLIVQIRKNMTIFIKGISKNEEWL